MVGAECLACRSDVSDHLGRKIPDRRLGRPLAVNQPVVCQFVPGQKIPDQIVVFCRDSKRAAVKVPELTCNFVEIVNCPDIRPARRNRDDKVGMTEPERADFVNMRLAKRQFFANQVLPGYSEVNSALLQFPGNLARRQKDRLDPVQSRHTSGVGTLGPQWNHPCAKTAEPVGGGRTESSLGRKSDLETAHVRPALIALSVSGRMTPPTAGTDRPCPRRPVNAS